MEVELADESAEWDINIDISVDERAVKVLTPASKKDYDDAVEFIHTFVKENKNPPQKNYLLAAFEREVQLELNKCKTIMRSIQIVLWSEILLSW